MSPQTIRHVAVAVVATMGVVLLYLWPTTARSPSGNPQQAPTATSPTSGPTTGPTAPGSSPTASQPIESATPYNPHQRVDTHSPQPDDQHSHHRGPAGSPSPSGSSTAPGTTAPPPATSSAPPSTTAPPTGTPTAPSTTPTPGGPTTTPSTPSSSPTASGSPTAGPTTTEPTNLSPPRDVRVGDETTETFSVSWLAPSDPDGLQGYQLYVRGVAQFPVDKERDNSGLISPTVESLEDLPWPYSDTTSDPEVCIAAVYPDGPDEGDEYDESDWRNTETCATAQKPEGAATAPSGESTSYAPNDEPTDPQSPSGPSTESTREEAP